MFSVAVRFQACSVLATFLLTSYFGRALAGDTSNTPDPVLEWKYDWHHPSTHPVHALFKRQTDHAFHPVGSPG
jgi:hypothetical protein